MMEVTNHSIRRRRMGYLNNLHQDWQLWVLLLPACTAVLLFAYLPMSGLIMAFQRYSPGKGVLGSPFVGFKWFAEFFGSYYFWRLIRNTFTLSFLPLLIGFPIPIIFAIALNDLRLPFLKKSVQFASYLPYFISTVVVVGLVVTFLSPNEGIVNNLRATLGLERISFLSRAGYFPWIYTFMVIWKGFGFNSILYLAAISRIPPSLYEAARIDGVNKIQEMGHITLPGMRTTIIIMLLLGLGSLMRTGFEEILLLYNESIYETADVITTFVYRQGIESGRTSYSTAVGLFNSIISFSLLVIFNRLARKFLGNSLW